MARKHDSESFEAFRAQSRIVRNIAKDFAGGNRGPVKQKAPPVHSLPVRGDDIAGDQKSARRWMPQDVELGNERRLDDRSDHEAGDADYFKNLRMPERRVSRGPDVHQPTRDQAGEPGKKPSIVETENRPATSGREAIVTVTRRGKGG